MNFCDKIDSILTANNIIFENYIKKLNKSMLTEGKVTVTTIVDIPDSSPEKDLAKQEILDKAKALGDFNNPTWVSHMVNGLKQAGVQGVAEIPDTDQPVSKAQLQKIIEMLIAMVGIK